MAVQEHRSLEGRVSRFRKPDHRHGHEEEGVVGRFLPGRQSRTPGKGVTLSPRDQWRCDEAGTFSGLTPQCSKFANSLGTSPPLEFWELQQSHRPPAGSANPSRSLVDQDDGAQSCVPAHAAGWPKCPRSTTPTLDARNPTPSRGNCQPLAKRLLQHGIDHRSPSTVLQTLKVAVVS